VIGPPVENVFDFADTKPVTLWAVVLRAEYLPTKEVLDEVRRLCLSQDCRAPAMVGTDLGDRLRDARAMYVRRRGNKKGHFAGLL
jgi:hypothetical protein